jgi:hypothetical protein
MGKKKIKLAYIYNILSSNPFFLLGYPHPQVPPCKNYINIYLLNRYASLVALAATIEYISVRRLATFFIFSGIIHHWFIPLH